MTTTPTYTFNVPTAGTEEDTWGALLNANWEKVDDLLDGTTAIVCARLTAYSLTGTEIAPDNGQIQYKSISTNTTFTASFAEGDAAILYLTISSSAVPTFPSAEWTGGSAPSGLANGKHKFSFIYANSTLHAEYHGPVS